MTIALRLPNPNHQNFPQHKPKSNATQSFTREIIIYLFRINQRTRTDMERLSGIKWINIR